MRIIHRRCLPLGCVLFLLVAGNARLAATAAVVDLPPAAKPTISLDLSAAQHYEAATRNLRAGRSFERAAEQLREAVRQEPHNYRYPLALGCAYASRAASLAYAAEFARRLADDQQTYPQRLAEWQKAQQKPDDYLATFPRPEPPAPFALYTRDDNRPFSMTPDQVQAAFDARSKDGAAAWEKAVSLTKTDQERAEAQYVRGWGLIVLEMYRSIPQFGTVRVPEEARKSLEAATRLDPENALYWQGLGDVHMGVVAAQPAAASREAKAAYEKSLAL